MNKPPEPNHHARGDPGGRSSGWSESNLKPIGFALAAAIVIIAIPMAFRISKCQDLNGGFSLSQLVSFSCSAGKGGGEEAQEVTREQLVASTLHYPEGYVAYRVDGGIARESGSLMPINSQPAPSFRDVQDQLILVGTAPKHLRERPFAQTAYKLLPEGTCFQTEPGFRFEDETPLGTRSGGWLQVKVVACPAGSTTVLSKAGGGQSASITTIQALPSGGINGSTGKRSSIVPRPWPADLNEDTKGPSFEVSFARNAYALTDVDKKALDKAVAAYASQPYWHLFIVSDNDEREAGGSGPVRSALIKDYLNAQGVPIDVISTIEAIVTPSGAPAEATTSVINFRPPPPHYGK